MPRVGPAAQAASDARSAVTGRVVDSLHQHPSVKMFAHHDRELTYAKDAIENARASLPERDADHYTMMDV